MYSLTLNYKGLPYKTTFLNFVDIKPTLQANNIPPSEGESYTLPAIIDPATGQAISDSAKIAVYLDTQVTSMIPYSSLIPTHCIFLSQYPDTPAVFPASTRAAQVAFMKSAGMGIGKAAFPLVLMDIFNNLDEKDTEYFRRTREAAFGGAPLEAITPKGEKREATKAALRAALDNAAKEIAAHSGDAPFFGGDSPVFADFAIAGSIFGLLKSLGSDHDVCQVFLTHEWASKYIAALEKYASIES